jgi:hypothetical protein
MFRDFLYSTHHLKLGDLINGIDRVNAFYPILVALMDAVYANKTRVSIGIGLTPLANL